MLNDRIEGAVLVIGRTAKLDARGSFRHDLLFECLHQAGFANARLATEQHDLACTCLWLAPSVAAAIPVPLLARPTALSHSDRHLKAALRFALSDDSIHRQGSGDAFECLGTQVLTLKQAFHQPMRRRTDHHRVRLGQSLDPRGNVRRLAQRQDLALLAAADLADDD